MKLGKCLKKSSMESVRISVRHSVYESLAESATNSVINLARNLGNTSRWHSVCYLVRESVWNSTQDSINKRNETR